MKQTALEWLMDKFLSAGYSTPNAWKKQAKEMEKEQMVDFSKVVLKEYKRIRPEDISTIKRLYNETFNTNEK